MVDLCGILSSDPCVSQPFFFLYLFIHLFIYLFIIYLMYYYTYTYFETLSLKM